MIHRVCLKQAIHHNKMLANDMLEKNMKTIYDVQQPKMRALER